MERVTIPFEGKQIIGYLRKPKGVARPPVVIATGGVDVYKEERSTNDLLEVGLAAFSMDMPGRRRVSGVEHARRRAALHHHD